MHPQFQFRPMNEMVIVVCAPHADQAAVDTLLHEINQAGFDATYGDSTISTPAMVMRTKPIGAVFVGSPGFLITQFHAQNPQVAVVAFGTRRSDVPGKICCLSSPKAIAMNLERNIRRATPRTTLHAAA